MKVCSRWKDLLTITGFILGSSEEQKQRYLERKIKKIRNQIVELNTQIGFISLVKEKGMPAIPNEKSGKTYVKSIEELRECIKIKILKENE